MYGERHLGVDPERQGKLTKVIAEHYLAEIYLVLNKPDSALVYANKVINTPNYKLITERYGVKANEPGVPFADMFIEQNTNREQGNTEALWTWQYELETIGGGANIMRRWHVNRYYSIKIGGVTPLEITVDRGGRPQGRMALTKYAIDLYEPQDDRGSNFILRRYFILKDEKQNDTGVADELPAGYNYGDTIWTKADKPITPDHRSSAVDDWPYSRKWDWANPADVANSYQYGDQVYLRLAETYLLKAEAQMKLNDLAGAAETLNVIRRRSNASEISASDVDMDFILDERIRELMVEEQRRHTLVRTGKWLERVQKYNHLGGQFATERDALFPIPQIAIDANLTAPMSQNPGY
ncbi:MAG: RagB/SusD family nutrient uptake outer membrane protein [Cyclobacteriaceae bacterium]|nr:RagB/SusD family nutrient uptake outer membrane protein [Cyclobacteriaceae bacterium]